MKAATTATNKCSLNSVFWVQCPYHHLTLETQTYIVNCSMENFYEKITQNSICNFKINKSPNTRSMKNPKTCITHCQFNKVNNLFVQKLLIKNKQKIKKYSHQHDNSSYGNTID